MELVKTTSFDEFIAEYYELNKNSNAINKSVATTESINDEQSETLTRRNFLKYSALGIATLIVGASTEKAEAFWPVLGWIILGATAWASDEYIDWRITIGNNSGSHQSIPSEWEVVDEKDYDVLDSSTYTFNVPNGKARTFKNKSLKANVNRDIYAFIKGNIGGQNKESSLFRILS